MTCFLLPEYTTDLQKKSFIERLSGFNNIVLYILRSIITLSYPRLCFHVYVLCGNVFISSFMCVCRIIIKDYLLTYCKNVTATFFLKRNGKKF